MAGFGTDLIPGLIQGKPVIPKWDTVDLGQSQTKAISQNAASLPALESLASNFNKFSLDQLTQALNTMIPGYDAMTKGAGGDINSLLKGELPTDVSAAVQNSDAAKALTGGFGGSGMAGDLVARDLGLTSLDLVGKGLSAAQSWIATMGNLTRPAMLDMSSMFVTPQQQFEDTMANQSMQFQRDYVSNMNDWQHSFKYLLGKDVQGTANTLLSMYGGMMMGGGGGMGKMMGGGSGSEGGGGGFGAGDAQAGMGGAFGD